MQQMKGQMNSSESLEAWWKYCCLVGFINQICIFYATSLLVIFALTIALGFPYCEYDQFRKMCTVYHSVERQTSPLAAAWMSLTLIYLLLAFLIKMIFVNAGLTSTKIPADGSKVKSWLRWHIFAFMILVATIIIGIELESSRFFNYVDEHYYNYAIAILCVLNIDLLIEFMFVRKFSDEYDISARGLCRNKMSVQNI